MNDIERLPNGILKKLSEATGKPVSHLSDLSSTRKRPSRDTANLLEAACGIPAPLWMFGTAAEIRMALVRWHGNGGS